MLDTDDFKEIKKIPQGRGKWNTASQKNEEKTAMRMKKI